jgi:hypothetical protein
MVPATQSIQNPAGDPAEVDSIFYSELCSPLAAVFGADLQAVESVGPGTAIPHLGLSPRWGIAEYCALKRALGSVASTRLGSGDLRGRGHPRTERAGSQGPRKIEIAQRPEPLRLEPDAVGRPEQTT